MSRLGTLFTLGLFACTDYDLQATQEPGGGADSDTGEFDPGTDTADTGDSGDDTGGGQIDTDDPEVATEPIYINSGSTLYSYDPATNVATEIGVFKERGVTVSSMTDIAIDLSGHMYGVAYTELYRITPATAAVEWLAELDDSQNALTFVSDGTLVAAGDGGVVTIDLTTYRQSRLGGAKFTSSGDIVGLPDGYLYWSVEGSGDDMLVQVDPQNGVSTELGSIGTYGVYALGYAYGDLYGFTSGNKSIVIDATTGRSSSTRRLDGSWWGATTNPVLW